MDFNGQLRELVNVEMYLEWLIFTQIEFCYFLSISV